MVRERISGGLGVIIINEDVIQRVLDYFNQKYPCDDGTLWNKYDLQDMYQLNAAYLDDNSTIAVYPDGRFGRCNYPDSGLVIWCKKDISMSAIAYFTKADMVIDLRRTLDDIGISNDVDYENYAGLILYTEYN